MTFQQDLRRVCLNDDIEYIRTIFDRFVLGSSFNNIQQTKCYFVWDCKILLCMLFYIKCLYIWYVCYSVFYVIINYIYIACCIMRSTFWTIPREFFFFFSFKECFNFDFINFLWKNWYWKHVIRIDNLFNK